MHLFNPLSLQFGLVLTFCGMISAQQTIFDFKLTPDMKSSDFDDPNSTLSNLIKYVVKGFFKKRSEYLTINPIANRVELGIEIKDSSIFCPGDKVENAQNGFRRTDVLPKIDPKTALVGTTVFHQSFRMNPQLPLNLQHGYLLASIEIPTGDHVFDIFTGVDLTANKTDPRTVRVRSLNSTVLYTTPLKDDTLYNFAVAVDWKANTLTVYASEGDGELKSVHGPFQNDPKVISPDYVEKGEWHAQLIKFPIPIPTDPEEKKRDVPHFGYQEPHIHEGVFFSRMFVEDGTNGKITTRVTNHMRRRQLNSA